MFFIGGITQGTKEIPYQAAAFICDRCGRYGNCRIYMTYMCLSLFFIPIFKWNRRYYVKTSCCGTVYELDQETGSRLARGESITVNPSGLPLIQDGHQPPAWKTETKRCINCGYETKEDFEYCPKCGQKF